MTRGEPLAGCKPPLASPNSASISSRTMRTTCWAGVQAAKHLLVHRPIADAIDECLDDLEVDVRLDSARRISRSAASTVASVSRPSPRMLRKTSWRRVLSASNM